MPGKKCDDNVHPNHLIIAAAASAGVKTGDLARALNITPQHVSRVKKNSEGIQWVTQRRIKKAIQAVDYFTDVKNYTGYVKTDRDGNEVAVGPDLRIRPADVLRASEMQLDRAFPTQARTLEIQSFTQVNVSALDFGQMFQSQLPAPQLPAPLDMVALPDSDSTAE
jgi:hypothetical protein